MDASKINVELLVYLAEGVPDVRVKVEKLLATAGAFELFHMPFSPPPETFDDEDDANQINQYQRGAPSQGYYQEKRNTYQNDRAAIHDDLRSRSSRPKFLPAIHGCKDLITID